MDSKEFEGLLKVASPFLNEERKLEVSKKLIATSTIRKDFEPQSFIIAMEELAELSQQLSKFLRGSENRISILEEMADVYICLDKIKSILNIGNAEINKAINIKIDRADMKLSKNGTYE